MTLDDYIRARSRRSPDFAKALWGFSRPQPLLWTPADPRNPNPRFDQLVTRPNRAYEDKPLTLEDLRTATFDVRQELFGEFVPLEGE